MKTRNSYYAKQRTCAPVKPAMRSDGTCSACLGGNLCAWHQAEGVRDYAKQTEALRLASIGARQAEIYRVCARYELESDEFFTREEKAISLIGRGFSR